MGGLIRALAHEDVITNRDGTLLDLGAPVREEAARALAELGGPAARRGLLSTLEDPEEAVRLAGIQALRRSSDPGTTNALLEAVVSWADASHARSRTEAIDALGEIGDATLPERLAAALLRRQADLTEADAEALRLLASADSAGRADSRVIEYLIEALGSEPEDAVRDRAVTMLVWLAPASLEALVAAVSDSNSQRKRRAAIALGEIRDSRAAEALNGLLEAEEPTAREAAAWALGNIKDPGSVEALLRASGDREYAVRSAATEGLNKLGTVAVILGVTSLVRPLLANGTTPEIGSDVEAQLEGAVHEADPAPVTRPVGLLRRLLERDPFP